MDETYVGSKIQNMHKWKVAKRKRPERGMAKADAAKLL